jgi:transcriptional regulator with XRE-family HTH domain
MARAGLARHIGVSLVLTGRYETGRARIPTQRLAAIAAALGVEIAELWMPPGAPISPPPPFY